MFGLGVVATSASSYISLDWVMSSGLRTSNSRASGRLTLPCDDGTISVCMNDIPVAAALPSDLVLGLDWFYSLPDSGSRIIVHLSCGSLDLQCPLPAIGLESGSSSSSMSAAWSPVAQVYRGSTGVEPLTSSSASQGGPGVVSTPSSTPRTRGADVVAVSPLRARSARSSRQRSGFLVVLMFEGGSPASAKERRLPGCSIFTNHCSACD
ncbi:hypothetical protein C8J57DRAFT_1379340 [Mycena rebaudengoi]|nr:hypothetical protein C8J57DRAFT_1379340 [Mycena rebaudengoi]